MNIFLEYQAILPYRVPRFIEEIKTHAVV